MKDFAIDIAAIALFFLFGIALPVWGLVVQISNHECTKSCAEFDMQGHNGKQCVCVQHDLPKCLEGVYTDSRCRP